MPESAQPQPSAHLMPLSALPDFEVAEGQPDIRGWEVLNAAREKAGKVKELIVDGKKLLVRYLHARLSPDLLPETGEKDVLIPIGLVTLSSNADQVTLPALTTAQLLSLPAYTGQEITRAFELEILAALPETATALPADFYGGANFSFHGLSTPRFRGQEPDSTSNTGQI